MAIGTELEERESSLTRQLQAHQSASASQISSLTSESARLKHDLDTALAQVSCTDVMHHACMMYQHNQAPCIRNLCFIKIGHHPVTTSVVRPNMQTEAVLCRAFDQIYQQKVKSNFNIQQVED